MDDPNDPEASLKAERASLEAERASLEAEKVIIMTKVQDDKRTLMEPLQQARAQHAQGLLALSQLETGIFGAENTFKGIISRLESEARSQIDDIDRKINELSQRGRGARIFAKFPAEILGYIFEQCIEGDQGQPGGEGLGVSPWILALVCHFWYQTAMRSPRLWGKIMVTERPEGYWSLERSKNVPDDPGTRQNARFHSAIQICVGAMELAKALQRTGASPLDITLGFRSDKGSPRPDRDFYEELYQMIFNKDVASRISRLVLDAQTAPLEGPAMDISVSLPNLTGLEVKSNDLNSLPFRGSKSFLRAILEGSTELRDIRLGGALPLELHYDTWSVSDYEVVISRIKRLRVYSRVGLNTMLRDSISIESLVIDQVVETEERMEGPAWNSLWPIPQTPEINFQRLTDLHLVVHHLLLLSRLKFPSLKTLRVTQPRSLASDVYTAHSTIDLPNLLSLQVASSSIALLNRFDMPHLESLHITGTHSSHRKCNADFKTFVSGDHSDTQHAIPPPTFLRNVKTLCINALISDRNLSSVLKAFPFVQTLRVVPGPKLGKCLIDTLQVTKHRRGTAALCPDLTALELDCHSFREWDKKTRQETRVGTLMPEGLCVAIEKLVTSRRYWGKQLERFTVVDNEGSKTEYA